MKLGSLFSGVGGLDLAVETVFGTETVWHCENDLAASEVLAHHWPGVPNLVTSSEHGLRHTWRPLTSVCPICGAEFTPHKTKRGHTKTCGQRCGAQLTWQTRRATRKKAAT